VDRLSNFALVLSVEYFVPMLHRPHCHLTRFTYIFQVEVLRICAAMDEMMDDSKEEGVTPGRATAGKSGGR
jgi:hypothetical protein